MDSLARRVVESFPPTSENYQKAIDHLKSRFGKEKILVEVYVRDLLKLVISNSNGNQKVSLGTLYDKLETKLRALESLGMTSDKYAAMLYPLVESCLSDDILVAWERIRNERHGSEEDNEGQLMKLMRFLQGEVESNIRLEMAKNGITSDEELLHETPKKRQKVMLEAITTSDLYKDQANGCLFCGNHHASQDCGNAARWTQSERIRKVWKAGKCFKCLKKNHLSRTCKEKIRCQKCNGNHYKLLCKSEDYKQGQKINAFSNYFVYDNIFMQILLVKLQGNRSDQCIRSMIDSGSTRSYVTRKAAEHFGLEVIGTIEISHNIFGGSVTSTRRRSVYEVIISGMNERFQGKFQVVEVDTICNSISPTSKGPWIEELAEEGIILSDCLDHECPIHVLFGLDTASKLYTEQIFETKDGPVAFETKFVWTMMGVTMVKGSILPRNDNSFIYSMLFNSTNIQDLWNLEIIGIHDAAERVNKEELSRSAMTHFKKSIKILNDGRYEVALPWTEGHQKVASNRELAERRLISAFRKLSQLQKVDAYQKIFDEWLRLGIIEKVPMRKYDKEDVSYLPHHPVFNDKSSTTPIRPVFDASARSKGFPSLNNCLEKGQNLLLQIPEILISFRENQYAVTSDIKKAFLQISVQQEDRDYLRFLWYEDGKIIILRHCRVVFGISSSPFLLAATLNHHLENESGNAAKRLRKSVYVDNCVTPFKTVRERDDFVKEATEVCAKAQFELKGWVSNVGNVPEVGSPQCGLAIGEASIVSVLGLLWNVREDTLSIDLRKLEMSNYESITKRTILAATHRIFDPLGFIAPSLLLPKLLLQELCRKKLKWDDKVPDEVKKKFLRS